MLTEEQSRPFIRKAIELGTNFFDTANVYSDGTSEKILGCSIRDYSARDDVVIAIKVDGRMKPVPNGIIGATEAALGRRCRRAVHQARRR